MREGEYGAVLGNQIEGELGIRNEELEMKVAASPPFLEDGILVSQLSPLGKGAPQGRIGHRRYERQMRKAEQRGICGGSARA